MKGLSHLKSGSIDLFFNRTKNLVAAAASDPSSFTSMNVFWTTSEMYNLGVLSIPESYQTISDLKTMYFDPQMFVEIKAPYCL